MPDLISVIIPVYNVENLINRCISSVTMQTYKNLEIILVDDGSTDGSPDICDQWKIKDSRIQVIHKNNGGLSDARNEGLKNANGIYINFVDSDDWLELNMIEKLYNSICQNCADIAICGIIITDGLKSYPRPWFENDKCMDMACAYAELLADNKITSHAWNKLFKKEIFDEIYFPKGKLYEDVRIMHKIFQKCNTISIVKEHLYNYYQRSDSITCLPVLSNKLACAEAFSERLEYVKTHTPEYSELVLFQIARSLYTAIVEYQYEEKDLINHKKELYQMNHFLRHRTVKKAIIKYGRKKDYLYFGIAVIIPKSANWFYCNLFNKFNRFNKNGENDVFTED